VGKGIHCDAILGELRPIIKRLRQLFPGQSITGYRAKFGKEITYNVLQKGI
jgi:hypothetical protein